MRFQHRMNSSHFHLKAMQDIMYIGDLVELSGKTIGNNNSA